MNNQPTWRPQTDGQQEYWDGQNQAEPVAPVVAFGPGQFAGPAIGQADTGEALEGARGAAMRMVWVGLAFLVVGIAITVGTYVYAAPGGRYFAAYGPVLFGVIRLGQGLFYRANPARLLK